MAFLEWRRFTFFDIHKSIDNGKVAENLQGTTITATTSGNSHVVLCDSTGWAHLVSRAWKFTSFKAYELTITLAQQLPHDPFLVTIGEDEAGTPLVKVWDWSRRDRHDNPTCVRVSRAVPSHMRATPATALAVHDNKNLLAVGFQDGSVTLYRGDIARQRSGKMKTLMDSGTSPITGLAFRLPRKTSFSGVIAMTEEQFTFVDGFSNTYWGFQGEDDDMVFRIHSLDYTISRHNLTVSRYASLDHAPDPRNINTRSKWYRTMLKARSALHNDGLSTLKYRVRSGIPHRLYTHIKVDIGRSPTYPQLLKLLHKYNFHQLDINTAPDSVNRLEEEFIALL